MKLRRRRDGLSALFDAILFFMIILVATGALFYWASAMTATTTEDMATRDLGRYAADVQSSALECTIGPMGYIVEGENLSFAGSVHDCLRTILLARQADINCDIEPLAGAVRQVYGLLVDRPFHWGLLASVPELGADLSISENAQGPMSPGAVRWTSAIILIINGAEGGLTLYIWR
jgi:hypothetical protein